MISCNESMGSNLNLAPSTIIELWVGFEGISRETVNGSVVISENFLKWSIGTNINTIYDWFDSVFKEYGGIKELMKIY